MNVQLKTIPDLSTTSTKILGDLATAGSGSTGQGVYVNGQVSLDWVRYSISKNVWNLLYTSNKVPRTENGRLLVENKIKEVLDVAVREGIFSRYEIIKTQQPYQDNFSFKFKAKLTHSILNADVEGTVYN